VAAVLLALLGSLAQATTTQRWVVDTADELVQGEGDGVAVTQDGRLISVGRWLTAVSFDEPIVLASAVDDDGSLIVGTGHPARLYRVQGSDKRLLAEMEQEQITALVIDGDGSVVVATVAPGVLYRWRSSGLEEIGRLGEGGIWDLIRLEDGTVVAAAGPPASLYRVSKHGLERFAELPDVHARCLTRHDGSLVVGTSGKGLLLAVRPEGSVALLADSPFTEISDVTVTADGTLWATAVVGEPAATTPTPTPPSNSAAAQQTPSVPTDLKLPKVNGATATSEVLRLTGEGALLSMHRFTKQVATTITAVDEAVIVGTGYEGELWRFTEAGGAKLGVVDAVNVVRLLPGADYALTQGPAQLLRRQQDEEVTFRSQPHKLGLPAHLGVYSIEPPGSAMGIRFRSGVSSEPDPTWLPWTDWLSGDGGTVPLPASQMLQWEVKLPGATTDRGGGVERVEVASQQVNLPPVLEAVRVAEPGEVFLAGPPPMGPVVDVGIFTVIDPTDRGNGAPNAQGKKYWRVGYRTVAWKAEDPNADPLQFAVELERRDGFVFRVREQLEATQLAVDTTAVPDGWYRFRVHASDEVQNPEDPRQTTQTSEWFVVDSTPPQVTLERRGKEWLVTVRDTHSTVTRVELSRDGEHWRGLAPSDGVLDEHVEQFRVAGEQGRHILVVRAIDRHHNRVTASAIEE